MAHRQKRRIPISRAGISKRELQGIAQMGVRDADQLVHAGGKAAAAGLRRQVRQVDAMA